MAITIAIINKSKIIRTIFQTYAVHMGYISGHTISNMTYHTCANELVKIPSKQPSINPKSLKIFLYRFDIASSKRNKLLTLY